MSELTALRITFLAGPLGQGRAERQLFFEPDDVPGPVGVVREVVSRRDLRFRLGQQARRDAAAAASLTRLRCERENLYDRAVA